MQSLEQGIERAAELEERQRQDRLSRLRGAMSGQGSELCVDCDEPIGDARLSAYPSAVRCIDCASDAEFSSRRDLRA